MLQPTFLTPEALNIDPNLHFALIAVLGKLEREEIHPNDFDMGSIDHCIIGHVNRLAAPTRGKVSWWRHVNCSQPLRNLCGVRTKYCPPDHIAASPSQAAACLRNYLTTGDPQFTSVYGGPPK